MDNCWFILHSFDSNIIFDTPLAYFFKVFLFDPFFFFFNQSLFFVILSNYEHCIYVDILLCDLCIFCYVSPRLLKVLSSIC